MVHTKGNVSFFLLQDYLRALMLLFLCMWLNLSFEPLGEHNFQLQQPSAYHYLMYHIAKIILLMLLLMCIRKYDSNRFCHLLAGCERHVQEG